MATEAVSVAQAVSGMNMLSIFGGAVVGSAISGVINIWLHWRTINRAATLREEERLEKRKERAFSFFVKLNKILSDGSVLDRDYQAAISKLDEKGRRHPSLLVLPQTPSPEKVIFTAEELALVLAHDDKLYNQVAALDRLHAVLADFNTIYAQKRELLFSSFGAKMMEGNLGKVSMTEEEHIRYLPRLIELDGIFSQLLLLAHDCKDEATAATTGWFAVMQREFGVKYKLEIRSSAEAS